MGYMVEDTKKGLMELGEQKAISFWVHPKEKERIKKDAKDHDMSVSEYVRWVLEKQRKEDESQ